MRILLAAGGSGGHIFPAVRVALACREKNFPCLVVGSLKFGRRRLEENSIAFEDIETCGFNAHRFFKACYLSGRALQRSRQIIREFQPDVVIGFGGYSSFPVCAAARLAGKPVLIHEQNVVPGKANRLVSLWARKVLVSFQKSCSFFPKTKCEVSGCPSLIDNVQVSHEEALRFFGFEPGRYTLLVFGGSQGSQKINRIFLKAARELYQKMPFQVIHLLGKDGEEEAAAFYRREGINAFVAPFLERMDFAYAAADLVLARAGALTVTEVICFQKAAIFVPYPHARAHQKENALALKGSPFAVVMEDAALNAAALIHAIYHQYERHRPGGGEKYPKGFTGSPAERILEEAQTCLG